VVIANLPYEDLKKMGIDYDTVSAVNPRVILATNSTFGSEGPYATRVGFDTIGQAMSGRHAPLRRRQGADPRQRALCRLRLGRCSARSACWRR
jgi:crotonobetainyl-CoA:carnitine CoA-transferase CaiB-like acyl-CoA transferase